MDVAEADSQTVGRWFDSQLQLLSTEHGIRSHDVRYPASPTLLTPWVTPS